MARDAETLPPGAPPELSPAAHAEREKGHEKGRQRGRAGREARQVLDLDGLAERWRARAEQIRAAVERPREPLALLGYEARDLEGFATASRWLPSIAGAGEIVASFDRRNLSQPLCVLAGGGRGVELVPRARAAERQAELALEFRQRTRGSALTTAYVPYEHHLETQSLRWLELALGDAAESEPSPGWTLARPGQSCCGDCGSRPAAAQGERNPAGEAICERCAAASAQGRKGADEARTLSDLAEAGRVTAVAAGGNLQALLGSLDTLEALGGLGALVFGVVEHAQREAERGALAGRSPARPGSAAPITGGAQVCALVAPSQALRYVGDLVRSVQSAASEAARLAGAFPEAAASRVARLGMSVGLVMSDARVPAPYLVRRARAAESLARRSGWGRDWRSALHVDRFSVDDDWLASEGAPAGRESSRESRSYSLEATSWQGVLRRAAALRRVAAAQRALARGRSPYDDEFWNHFRYEVSRSAAWKRYYRACGADWREPVALLASRPDRGLEILAELVT